VRYRTDSRRARLQDSGPADPAKKGTTMTTSTPLDSRERLLDQFDAMVDQGEQLLKTANDTTVGRVDALHGQIEQRLAHATERFARLRADAMHSAGVAVDATDAYVRGNPWRAVAIVAGTAAAAGLVVGMLASRHEP
jgi:ElaB/YqjD/DUF883 family membrane-anchored ribosome-binding protein